MSKSVSPRLGPLPAVFGVIDVEHPDVRWLGLGVFKTQRLDTVEIRLIQLVDLFQSQIRWPNRSKNRGNSN